MTTVRDFYDFIDSMAPFSAEEPGDNNGILVGDPATRVSRAAVVLDITPEAIAQAKTINAELIVSHHPVLFKPQKNFTAGNIAYELAVAGIAAICAHTPLDCAAGGVNDVLAGLLNLTKTEPFPTSEFEVPLVRAGFLPKTGPDGLATFVSERLNAVVRYNAGGRNIESVAVCGGSGGSCLPEIIEAGIDAYVTGDASYHHFLAARQAGMTLIAAGHFETENPVVPVLAQRLRDEFPCVEVSVLLQNTPISYAFP